MTRKICIVFLVLFAWGCATSHAPREGGFFGGVAGLSSGTYQKRVEEREARLSDLRATQRRLEDERVTLEAQKTSLQKQLEEDRANWQALQADLAAVEKETSGLTARRGTDQKRVAELQRRLQELKTRAATQQSSLDALEGSGLGDEEMELKRKQLEAQRNALRKEFDLLMKMQTELSR